MATAVQPIPAQPLQSSPLAASASAANAENAERALVPSGAGAELGEGLEISPDAAVARLPVELEIGVPLRDFRVRNLLALIPGTIVVSRWSHGEDLPLSAGDVQLAWTEFEVVDTTLAARLTRVA